MTGTRNQIIVAGVFAVLTLGLAGCPHKTDGGGCKWEPWEGTCELASVDQPTDPNSSGNVIVRAHYTISPAAGSGAPPAEFVHAVFATPDQAASARAHLERHPSVHCASAQLTAGSCGPWNPTFELPEFDPDAQPADAP